MDPLVPYRFPGAIDLPAAVRDLRRAGVLRALKLLGPVLAGTLPLGLNVRQSDADILCRLQPESIFRAAVHSLSHLPAFSLRFSVRRGRRTAVCRIRVGRLPVEIFAQAGPLRSQRAYRHLEVEHRLLSLGGEPLRERLLDIRRTGVKMEPAFAQLLRLAGDPYDAMERLACSPDGALRDLLRRTVPGLLEWDAQAGGQTTWCPVYAPRGRSST